MRKKSSPKNGLLFCGLGKIILRLPRVLSAAISAGSWGFSEQFVLFKIRHTIGIRQIYYERRKNKYV